jgi:hypothetical protein
MKHTTCTTLAGAALLALAVALLAGKDDIRRFRRMRNI